MCSAQFKIDPPSPGYGEIGSRKVDNRGARAFTLIEVTMAVAILGMMSLAIYRFVQTNVVALRVAAEVTRKDARYDALRDLLMAQFQALVPGTGALQGDALKLGDRPRDEIRWICGAGPGLLTRYAGGDYLVTMRLRPHKKDDGFDLGFLRTPENDRSIVNENDSWVSLLTDVQSLQIRYYLVNAAQSTWLDKWSDPVTLPLLVKITIARAGDAVPWVVIIPLRRTPL